MSETIRTSAGRPGLFNRDLAGVVAEPNHVRIERDRIRFFASVLGETDPVHHDLKSAQSAGYPDLLAPPTFAFVIGACADEERVRQGQQTILEWIGANVQYLLHGGESYKYHGPIFAGDEVAVVSCVMDFTDKKGGQLEFVNLETRIMHPDRGALATVRRTLIHRFG